MASRLVNTTTTHSHRGRIVIALLVGAALFASACSATTETVTTPSPEATTAPAATDEAREQPNPTGGEPAETALEPDEPDDEPADSTQEVPEDEAADTPASPVDPQADAWAAGLTVGVCFNETETDGEIEAGPIVDCTDQHLNELYHRDLFADEPGAPWPGFDDLIGRAFDESCEQELVEFAGRPEDLLPFSAFSWVPNDAEWSAGSRTYLCTVGAENLSSYKVGTAAGGSMTPTSTDVIISLVNDNNFGGLALGIAGPGETFAPLTVTDINVVDNAPAFDGGHGAWFVADPDRANPDPANSARSTVGSLFWIDLRSSSIERSDAFGARLVRNPTLAPDGRLILSVSPDGESWDLWSLDPASGATEQLTSTAELAEDHPSASPDGTAIAYSATDEQGRSNLWLLANGSDTATALTTAPTTGGTGDWDPAVSPDGTTIAYTSDQGGYLDVWSIGIDGANPTNLTQHPAVDDQPVFSLETDRVFFQSDRFGKDSTTMFMLRDGSEQSSLTFDAVHSPTVLPFEVGQLAVGAAYNNFFGFCEVPGGQALAPICGVSVDGDVISVTAHPEPQGAPWPGEETIAERTVLEDCKAALDEMFGADREPMPVLTSLIDEDLWDFGLRSSFCHFEQE